MVNLVSLPAELLQQISGLLLHSDQKTFGGACQLFRSLVAPGLFQKLTICLPYNPSTEHRLQALANPHTTMHSLAGLFTKHLVLRIYPPGAVRGSLDRPPEKEAQRMREVEKFPGNLGPALIALKRCESLTVSVKRSPHDGTIPAWLVDILRLAMASISTLKELELLFPWSTPPPAIVAADSVLGLQRYAVSAGVSRHWREECTAEFTAALLSSIDTAIAGKPELRELKVDTEIYRSDGQGVPTIGQLFSGACMSSSPPLDLSLLELDGWSVDEGLSIALPHLKNLYTLNLGRCIIGSVDLIWDTLFEASIFLKSLRSQNTLTPALFRYLSSYQGLEEVSLLPRRVEGRSFSNGDSVRLCDVLDMLSNHKASLRRLAIVGDSLGYSVDDAAALRQFAVLEKLDISVAVDVLPQLMDVVFSLPCLAVLYLAWPMAILPSGSGSVVMDYEMIALMGRWIEEFVIPITATGSKIKDVWIVGGKSFWRCGDRFRYGVVEPDGKWREIGKDEVLGWRGWVIKRPLKDRPYLSPPQAAVNYPCYGEVISEL